MKTITWNSLSERQRKSALTRPVMLTNEGLSATVADILADVKANGDEALIALTAKFDKVTLASLAVTEAEFRAAEAQVLPETLAALKQAAANIEAFHVRQVPTTQVVETAAGVFCERHFRPISRIGLYVPGGSACLPSTVLMLGIPSRLAGCALRVLCTPPRTDGSVDPHILTAAKLCGIDRVFKVGGAQAIGAMAYGTVSVPKVDKIFGPGNAWVTEAKQQVVMGSLTAIDMPAGPSEVLVVADAMANPVFVAADLLSQAEHGPDSQVVLVTPTSEMVEKVAAEITKQLADLPRAAIARQALDNSFSILVNSLEQAIAVANDYAPEHLILQVENPTSYREKIVNAGSVFLGGYSPESAGDYASGTNHVLPTYGHARAISGLSVDSFLKQITFQLLTKEGLKELGPTIETLAGIEGLEAHRRAVSLRLKTL